MTQKLKIPRRFFTVFVFSLLLGLFIPQIRSYGAEGETIEFVPSEDAAVNGRTLTALLKDDEKRTIVFPQSGEIRIDRVLWIGDNKTIIANDCTIIQTKKTAPLILHEIDQTNFKSLRNVTVIGGTWKTVGNSANVGFRFAHASNITLDGCSVPVNYQAHGISIIACKDVTVKNCTVLASGKATDTSLEEAIQIDVATAATAPVCAESGKQFAKGQTCENITIKNCTLRGSRGLCCNFTRTENNKYVNKFHKNIKIIGNTITGTSAQSLTLHNTVGFTVKGNTLITKNKRYDTTYSDGLNITMLGTYASSAKYKNSIVNNTIKGGRFSLYIGSITDSRFGPTTIRSNKLYCRKGAANALKVGQCTKLIKSKNKTYTWKQ